jgi:hypothetical protein
MDYGSMQIRVGNGICMHIFGYKAFCMVCICHKFVANTEVGLKFYVYINLKPATLVLSLATHINLVLSHFQSLKFNQNINF